MDRIGPALPASSRIDLLGSVMTLRDSLLNLFCILFRFFPVTAPVGLIAFGKPTERSPVFVSGNWFYVVRRLRKKLAGRNCYLLVADSAGINVWCASGVGDFNEHKIADAVNSSGLKELVSHRTLILPQLCAVGVDKEALKAECSFGAKWGPADLEDLDKFFENSFRVTDEMRLVHWSRRENVYIAIGKLVAYYLWFSAYGAYVLFFGAEYNSYALFVAVMLLINLSATVAEFKTPFRWPATYVVAVGVGCLAILVAAAYIIHLPEKGRLPVYLVLSGLTTFVVAADMIGNEHLKTTLGHWLKTFNAMSLFQPTITERCESCGECIRVCPKGLFSKDGEAVRVNLDRICSECLACVKQCQRRAIVNSNRGSYKKDIKVIRDIEEIMN